MWTSVWKHVILIPKIINVCVYIMSDRLWLISFHINPKLFIHYLQSVTEESCEDMYKKGYGSRVNDPCIYRVSNVMKLATAKLGRVNPPRPIDWDFLVFW